MPQGASSQRGNAITRSKVVASRESQYSAQASKDINDFCWRLEKNFVGSTGKKKTAAANLLMQADMKDIWFRCWAAAVEGAIRSPEVLLKTLLVLPANGAMLPPSKCYSDDLSIVDVSVLFLTTGHNQFLLLFQFYSRSQKRLKNGF